MTRLHELLGSAITIAEDMKKTRGPLDDPRPSALVVLLQQARDMGLSPPLPIEKPRVACCPRCALEVAKMDFHHNDNMNICPVCSAPLRP